METRSKANQKRQLGNENHSSPKRKSQPLPDQRRLSSISSDEQDEATKITNLTDCCLEKIFEHLDLPNLRNVAAANRWLRPAAGAVYKRKLENQKVWMSNYPKPSRGRPCAGDSIFVIGLKSCLQLLRCLGSSINVCGIFYDNWTKKQSDYILQYLNQYCAETLTEIEFQSKSKMIPIIPFVKPFVNVQTVLIVYSDLHDQLPSFGEWFPNMRTLKLEHHSTLRHKDSAIKFDHLEHLSLHVDQTKDGMGITEIKTHMLQQLPQLQSLDFLMFGSISFDATLNIIKKNQSIRNLKVRMDPYARQMTVATVSDIQRLVDEHPLLINFELIGLNFTTDTVNLLISQLNSLKQLRLQIKDSQKVWYRNWTVNGAHFFPMYSPNRTN